MSTNEVVAAYGRFLREVWQRPYPADLPNQVRLWCLFWQQVKACPPP